MTTKKKTPKKKTQAIRMASVDEMLAQGTPHEPEVHSVTIRATRTFDQMVRGETAVVDPEETYWSDNIRGGNLEVIE